MLIQGFMQHARIQEISICIEAGKIGEKLAEPPKSLLPTMMGFMDSLLMVKEFGSLLAGRLLMTRLENGHKSADQQLQFMEADMCFWLRIPIQEIYIYIQEHR